MSVTITRCHVFEAKFNITMQENETFCNCVQLKENRYIE